MLQALVYKMVLAFREMYLAPLIPIQPVPKKALGIPFHDRELFPLALLLALIPLLVQLVLEAGLLSVAPVPSTIPKQEKVFAFEEAKGVFHAVPKYPIFLFHQAFI
uniref:Uncharacterized protein n=1 Tax=viral metagenome TaxID=1070528 RepID=A0A6H1ZMQ3_9ZZZZ